MPALSWQLDGLPRLSLYLGGFTGHWQKGHFPAGFVLLSRRSACVVSWLMKRLALYCSLALV